jgi:hypothetical protein
MEEVTLPAFRRPRHGGITIIFGVVEMATEPNIKPANKQVFFIMQLTPHFIPRRRTLLEKMVVVQPVKKFLTFKGTQGFIIESLRARHLTLSSVTPA